MIRLIILLVLSWAISLQGAVPKPAVAVMPEIPPPHDEILARLSQQIKEHREAADYEDRTNNSLAIPFKHTELRNGHLIPDNKVSPSSSPLSPSQLIMATERQNLLEKSDVLVHTIITEINSKNPQNPITIGDPQIGEYLSELEFFTKIGLKAIKKFRKANPGKTLSEKQARQEESWVNFSAILTMAQTLNRN